MKFHYQRQADRYTALCGLALVRFNSRGRPTVMSVATSDPKCITCLKCRAICAIYDLTSPDDFEGLLAESSLGSPQAQAIRALTPSSAVGEIRRLMRIAGRGQA
jgi:hypothetical protein